MVLALVPDDPSPRRPRRRWWRVPRPRRRAIAGRTAVVVVPVTAAVPVLVRAPAVVPTVARAPVVVISRCRWGHRLGGAGGQAESACGHATSRPRAGAPTEPRPCLLPCARGV